MTTTHAHGLANLRDAGGLTGRPGILYRSDAPIVGDPRPEIGVWPPRTVLDLREAGERVDDQHPWERDGTAIVTLPVASFLEPAAQARMRDVDLELTELYQALIERAPGWLPQLVQVVAHGPGPVLIHCAAGKDRTGIAVALLLRAVGVTREDVLADYLRTNDALGALHARLRLTNPVARDIPTHLLGVRAEALDAVLGVVGVDPGAYLLDQGVAPADLERWRARLA